MGQKPTQPQASTQPAINPNVLDHNFQHKEVICKHCHEHVQAEFYFCPNCGNKIHEPPYKFSLLATIGVILESILLPPLGIFPGVKYLRKDDHRAKIIGITAIILTILSMIFLVMFLKNYINSVNKQLNDVNYLQNMYENPQGSAFEQAKELQKLNQ